MPKQTTDHCPANDKVLETKEDSTVTYISCENALAILVAKWQATKEELAAWVFLGPEQGGLAAFLDAYQITPPRQFFYPYCAGCEDYLWPLSLWWFRQNDIEQFVPADRYITGASLIERWSTLKSSHPEDYIIARVRESRLVDMHPTFGGTRATFNDPLPGLSYPPVESGLFSIKQIEALEVEEGITPSTDNRHDKTPPPVAAPPTTARAENHLSEGKETMPKRATDYESYLRFMDGAVWLLKEDALRLGAGYLPGYDDKKRAPKLLAPNEQAELNRLTLLGAFNDTRDWLKITRPMTFERDGYRYVEARGFLDWLSQYICQTQAKEFTFPGELADAIKRAMVMAAASAPAADEEFVSLTRALDGWFDKDWECLPPALRQQIEQKTTVLQFLWKTISPEQRLDCARQWDYRHDPATEPERQRLFQFYAELNDKLQEARDKLAEWESVAAPDAGDLEKKESHIEKWRREVARLELLENSAQATTCDDTSRLGDGMESAGVGVDYKSLLGEMEKAVIGPEKLCRAFGCGENSFSAVTRRVKAYNDRYPDAPIQFGRIGQSPILYWHEIYKIIGAVGGCSGKRTRKKTSKKT